MMSFLKAVAQVYASRWKNREELCFVLPNRRSCAFLTDNFNQLTGTRAAIAPRIVSIADFTEQLSERVVDSRIDLLFLLYDQYRSYIKSEDTVDDSMAVSFDNFRIWADTLLEDFNDVEMWMVPTRMLFKNVSNLREIESSYLTEQQLKVIKEYFGIEHYSRHIHGFWAHYNNPEVNGGVHGKKFYRLWQLMQPLYERLCEALEARSLTFRGRAFRQALDRIKNEGAECIGASRIVFVGLNALTKVEEEILSECAGLKGNDENGNPAPLADFYWDIPAPPIDTDNFAATHFVVPNNEKFPSLYPEVYELCKSTGITSDITYIASPSNVAQSKIAGLTLKEWIKDIPKESFDRGRVAIMLPDAQLLYPMLHSLPSAAESEGKISGVNLTMGYPFAMTSTYTLLTLYARMHRRSNIRAGIKVYLRQDVEALFQHPFSRLLLGAEGDKIKMKLLDNKRFTIECKEVANNGSRSELLYGPLEGTTRQITERIIKIYTLLLESLNDNDRRRLDASHLNMTIEALTRLANAIERYRIETTPIGMLSLMQKALAGETVRMEGEPLSGLQIMGPLETRCLDFDYLIIPSMNEKVFPRRSRKRSFIPTDLRVGYEMDNDAYQESIFAYNFFRLFSRAKRVMMIYDARMGESRSGDPSRYVQQLKHIYARDTLKMLTVHFEAVKRRGRELEIEKIGKVDEELKLFEDYQQPRRYSASALSSFIGCGVKYCLSELLDMREPEQPQDFLSPSMVGNVTHAALQHIYTPELSRQGIFLRQEDPQGRRPELITADFLRRWLDNPSRIDNIIARCIYAEEHGLRSHQFGQATTAITPGLEVYFDPIRSIITNALQLDLQQCPFTIYGTEIKEKGSLQFPSGIRANYTYVIDRLDFVTDSENPEGIFRIVDYKTGKVDLKLESPNQVFDNDEKKAAFQLLFYANLFSRNHLEGNEMDMRIFDLKNFKLLPIEVMDPATGKYKKVSSHCSPILTPSDKPTFMEGLEQLIANLQNRELPFLQCPSGSKTCSYCPYRVMICNR